MQKAALADRLCTLSIGTGLTDFFQRLLVNIEIGINVLNVVGIFQRFQQADHGIGSRAFQLHISLRNHTDF